jgi:hypothetical protein
LRKQNTLKNIACGVDKTLADRAPPSGFETKFAVGSVAPVSFLKTEGSILYP